MARSKSITRHCSLAKLWLAGVWDSNPLQNKGWRSGLDDCWWGKWIQWRGIFFGPIWARNTHEKENNHNINTRKVLPMFLTKCVNHVVTSPDPDLNYQQIR